MTTPLIRLDLRADGVAVLTLDRPDRLNALSSALALELADLVGRVAHDGSIGAIVVAGAGRAFCAGADIDELATLSGPSAFAEFVHGLTDALDVLAQCRKPSVAAIHGVALGGGLELALACDLRVAEEASRLGVPEIRLGLLPGAGGTARLPRLLPPGVARQLLLTGEPLLGVDAYRLGLVNELASPGKTLEVATALAARLAALPPLALAAVKRLSEEGPTLSLAAAVALERDTVSALFGTEDRAEGVRAFLERRVPRFRGR